MTVDLSKLMNLRETAQVNPQTGQWDLEAIFNRELYPMVRQLRAALAAVVREGGYTTIQDEGVALDQQTTLNFIGSNVTVTNNALEARTDVTMSEQSLIQMFEWGAGDFGSTTNVRYLWSGGSGLGAISSVEDRAQIIMLVAGTWTDMRVRVRSTTFGNSWTTTFRVNGVATACQTFIANTNLVQDATSSGHSIHTVVGDLCAVESLTGAATAVVGSPYAVLRFVPDPP